MLHDDISRKSAGNIRANSDHDGEKSSLTRKKINWGENTMKPKPKEHKEGKIIDWLKEQRVKHSYDK